MKVYELIEELKKCNPNAVVVHFDYDKESGDDIVCISTNDKRYSRWDKYQVILRYIRGGNDVVVLSDYDLDKVYERYGYDDEDED